MIPIPSSSFDEKPTRKAGPGRPRGSRAKLADRFFADFYAAWEDQGPAVIARSMFHDPVATLNVAARLMPQKIEHITPTDGMTDERLAEMLELTERMIELRRSGIPIPTLTHQAIHENEPLSRCAEEGGGGPERSGDAARGGSTSTSRDASEENGPIPHEDLNNVKTPEPEKSASVYDDRTPVTPYSLNNDIPHPVGRPFPKADHDVSRSNRAALAETDEENIDPQSLF